MRFRLILSTLLTAAAVAMSGAASAKTILKFSIGAPESGGGEIMGMKALKEYVEFKSGGELEIRLFFNTFGGSLQVTEQVKNGTLEMALTDDSVLGSFHRPMQVFQIPYLFPSSPVAWEFICARDGRGHAQGHRHPHAGAFGERLSQPDQQHPRDQDAR
jgi:TRAP-type C4-dicarboxylate transport system substrate-binding protein